jgi:phosphoribosylformylglycinamidine cyclo-ligase
MTTYESRGVSPDKGKVLKALEGTSKTLFPGAFAQALPDVLSGSADHCFLLHADGAGTKSSLAYLWWKETGDSSGFRNVAEDSLVMNLDDLLCVGATGPFVYSNIINRNAGVFPEELVGEVAHGYLDLAERLERYGVVVEPCGGETADVGDLVRTVTIDSVVATRMPRGEFINVSAVEPGLAIVGLASFGRAEWELAENSGIGSNGFTSARHEILLSQYRTQYPESFNPDITDLAYTGRFVLTDPLPDSDLQIGQALLSPTRTYAPVISAVLGELRSGVRGIVHNSGGGLAKCLHFGSGVRYVKDTLFPLPPVFRFLKDEIGVPAKELIRVFNLGQRMEVLCDPAVAPDVCAAAEGLGVGAQVIGRTEGADADTELVVDLDGEVVVMTGHPDVP